MIGAVPVAAVLLHVLAPQPAGVPQLEADLRAEAQRAGLPNLLLGVVRAGELVWNVSLGSEPVDAQTVYRIGSITKVFSALAILQLRDAGKLSLDDRADKWIRELTPVYPTKETPPITIRHILTHTSGLPAVGSLEYRSPTRAVPEAELLAAVKNVALESTPGTHTGYSNLAMALTGLIIARASGQPYRAYMQTHLFDPLGMASTGWDPPAKNLATGYLKEGTAYVRSPGSWRLGAVEAAGGIYTTLNDMTRFLAFQMNAWPPRDAPDAGPVRRSTVRESQAIAGFARAGLTGSFGAAWIVAEDARLGHVVKHTGSTLDYSAAVALAPRRHLAAIALAGSGDDELVTALAKKTLLAFQTMAPQSEVLGPPAATAFARVRSLLNGTADAAAIGAAFSPAFLRVLPAATLVGFFAKSRLDKGLCHGAEVRETISPVLATVRLTCEHGQWDMFLRTSSVPPYLLEELREVPVKP